MYTLELQFFGNFMQTDVQFHIISEVVLVYNITLWNENLDPQE